MARKMRFQSKKEEIISKLSEMGKIFFRNVKMTVTASQYLFELAIARSMDQIIHSSTHSPLARGFPLENWAWHPIDEYVQVLRVHQAWEVWRGATSPDLQIRKWVFRLLTQPLVKKM